jgi:hypothetical protein
MIGDSLRVHEEFMLLSRGEQGRMVGSGQHANAAAAAALAELLLHNRIALDAQKRKTFVRVTDSRLLGDAVLDEALERMRTAKRPLQLSSWLVKIATTRKLTQRITERLWLSGLLRREERPFLLFFQRTHYPIAHPAARQNLIQRLRTVILSNDAVDQRTSALLTCTYGNGVLPQVLERKQLKPRKSRIKAVIDSHDITRELAKALQASTQHYAPVP